MAAHRFNFFSKPSPSIPSQGWLDCAVHAVLVLFSPCAVQVQPPAILYANLYSQFLEGSYRDARGTSLQSFIQWLANLVVQN